MKAVIDRFEGDYAIVLLGDEEEEIKAYIPKQILPSGIREGSWLSVCIKLDTKQEKMKRGKISKFLDKLKMKGCCNK